MFDACLSLEQYSSHLHLFSRLLYQQGVASAICSIATTIHDCTLFRALKALMETRIRRYLALRRLNHGASSDLTSMGDENRSGRTSKRLGLALTPSLARTDARSKRRVDTTTNTDRLALKSSPYESTQAGKPPVVGGAPVKGNGPVRLQHNVRLSSGELLATEQSNKETLEDIKNGDYIVGRKEYKRSSQPKKAGTWDNRPKPPPLDASQALETHSLPQTPFFINDTTFENSPSSFTSTTENIHVRGLNSFDPHRSTSSLPQDYSRLSESRSSFQRASGSRNDNEGNVLIQALWKAEYNQLLSIQHQKYRITPKPSARFDEECRPSSRDVPYIEGHCSPDLQAYYHSPTIKDISFTDGSSAYSSANDHSGTSSNRTDSTCTARTSFQPDAPGTRDDVRRMIEDMRAMYLSAIESRSATSSHTSLTQAVTTRASVGPTATPQRTSASRPAQKSWHAGNRTSKTSRPKPQKKRKPAPTSMASKFAQPTEGTLSPRTSPTKPSLTRADSMTLGSILGGAPRATKSPPSTVPKMRPERLRSRIKDSDDALPPSSDDFQNMI